MIEKSSLQKAGQLWLDRRVAKAALRQAQRSLTLLGWVSAIALSACTEVRNAPTTDRATDPDCVENFDPNTDYFPDKAEVDRAAGFTIDYRGHYKVVTVLEPWRDADRGFEYVLVQCGTPIPDGVYPTQVVTIPVRSIVALSTTHLAHLDRLGVVDRLVGTGSADHISTESVRDRLASGEAIEVTRNLSTNVEAIIGLDPDLVMTHSIGDPNSDMHPVLSEAGLTVVLNAEYVEKSPLGRAEWLKFTAAFFNREAVANSLFQAIEWEYLAVAQMATAIAPEDKPTVVSGFSYQGTWYVPGGESFAAQLFADAGAAYAWSDTPISVSIPLDFEAVYDIAGDADVWLNGDPAWQSRADAIADDPRYGEFRGLDRFYNHTARTNATGGNDYWETGPIEPQVGLADLVQIFHPELLGDRELIYYKPLDN